MKFSFSSRPSLLIIYSVKRKNLTKSAFPIRDRLLYTMRAQARSLNPFLEKLSRDGGSIDVDSIYN